jgi:hypothetical protein
MKKTYLSIFVLSISLSALSQRVSDLHSFKTPEKLEANLDYSPKVKPSTNTHNQSKALNILWADDFSGGAGALQTSQGQWTVGGNQGTYWTIGDIAHPLNGWSTPWVDNMNAEHLRWNSYGPNSAEATGFASTPIDGEIISPTIPISGITNSIGLEFNTEAMFCCNYQELPFGVSVSLDDGLTWTDTLVIDLGIERNVGTKETANPLFKQINLDAIVPAGFSGNLKIKFVWEGVNTDTNGQYNTHYFWLLDDVVLFEIPSDDVALIQGWHGDIINDWEYSILPVTQSAAMEMIPGVVLTNQGVNSQTIDITCEISDGSSIVNTTIVNHTIASGVTDTVWFSTGFMPSTIGTYTPTFSVPADDDLADNSITVSELNVHANLMAHDYGAITSVGWSPTSTSATTVLRAEAPHAYGNIYTPAVNQDIYGIDAWIGSTTTVGLYLLARVQEMTGTSIQDPLTLITQIDHTVAAGEPGSVVTFTFPVGETLEAGKSYIIDLFKVDATNAGERFYVGRSSSKGEDDDYSTANFGPYGAANAVNYYNGWGYAPYIRANFDASLSVATNTLEGVSVYPNPSAGQITISNKNKFNNTIEVYDLTGKLVSSHKPSTESKTTLSISQAGVYLVNIQNENGRMVERVVIQ